jgi:hypothetical protein
MKYGLLFCHAANVANFISKTGSESIPVDA